MKKTFSILAALAVSSASLQTASSGDYFYGDHCQTPSGGSDNGCCFSYDYVDVAYIYSNYSGDVPPNVLNGNVQTTPNGNIVDDLKGVDVEFRKAIGCNFYLAGEFYNTDGFLSDEIVAANPALRDKRAEFSYYRFGVGGHHSISCNLDFTFEVGGLFFDCDVPDKIQDEWGWYISPGLRYSLGGFGELYASYSYENYETYSSHRVDGGIIVPLPCSDSISVKLAGRYESEYEKGSFLAGFRFNY